MSNIDAAKLQKLVQRNWSRQPSDKAQRYVGRFFDNTVTGTKIVANVNGNHGTYTVSAEIEDKALVAACSCYIGKGGYCHHCEALLWTYLQNPAIFREVQPTQRGDVQSPGALRTYLQDIMLDDLIQQLREKGITQKAFAEMIGMNPRHLAAIKSSEARNHYFNELGATKLACLWLLEHIAEFNDTDRNQR